MKKDCKKIMRKGYKKTGKTEQVSKQENRTAKKRTERERERGEIKASTR